MVTRPGKVAPIPPPEYQKCKVVLIGECAIGKTSFCKAISGKEFPADYEPTVGSDFYMKNMALGDGLFQFNVWDLSGDQTYVEVRNEFYKESQAIILMYDIARRSSFDALDMWIREASKHGGENLPVFVVGNKKDLDNKRAIPKTDAEKWVK